MPGSTFLKKLFPLVPRSRYDAAVAGADDLIRRLLERLPPEGCVAVPAERLKDAITVCQGCSHHRLAEDLAACLSEEKEPPHG
jgi:hypothetical protein